MVKTTVYLPEHLKGRLNALARRTGRSEAEIIRGAIERAVSEEPPPPRLGLFGSGDPTLAERVDEILAEGFGRD